VKLIEGEVPVDPGNLPIFSIFIHQLFQSSVEALAEWTFEIRKLYQLDWCGGVPENVIVGADRLHGARRPQSHQHNTNCDVRR
jgi:hypothetical protein